MTKKIWPIRFSAIAHLLDVSLMGENIVIFVKWNFSRAHIQKYTHK